MADTFGIPTLTKIRLKQINLSTGESQLIIGDAFAASRPNDIAIQDCNLFDAPSLFHSLTGAGCKRLHLSGLDFQSQTRSEFIDLLMASLTSMAHLEDLELGCVDADGDHRDGDYLSVLPNIARCLRLRTLKLHTLNYERNIDQALADVVGPASILEEITVVVPRQYHDARLTSPVLVAAISSNYALKRVSFEAANCLDDPRDADFKAETELVTRLNRSGRVYMASDAENCRTTVKVLGSVSDSLDCIFFHLRGNPLLCKRQHQPSTPIACRKRKAIDERVDGRNGT